PQHVVVARQFHAPGEQDPHVVGRLPFTEQFVPFRDRDLITDSHQLGQLLLAETFGEKRVVKVVGDGHMVSRYMCTRLTAVEPSPTADATRFIDARRTSPAANTPGRLVSNRNGARDNGHRDGCPSSTTRSGPVRMKPLASRAIASPSQSVRGNAPMNAYSQLASTISSTPVARSISVNFSRWSTPLPATTSVCRRTLMLGVERMSSTR